MTRDEYLGLMRDLLLGDPERVREANRRAYGELVMGGDHSEEAERVARREADLVLAEIPQSMLH